MSCFFFFFRPRSPAGESMRRIYIIIMKIASQGAPRTGLTLRRTARSPWTRVRVSAECSRVVDFIGIAILPPSICIFSAYSSWFTFSLGIFALRLRLFFRRLHHLSDTYIIFAIRFAAEFIFSKRFSFRKNNSLEG